MPHSDPPLPTGFAPCPLPPPRASLALPHPATPALGAQSLGADEKGGCATSRLHPPAGAADQSSSHTRRRALGCSSSVAGEPLPSREPWALWLALTFSLPALPLQFFTCLVILFACEVAAGIWGFVNKDQVSGVQVEGRGSAREGLSLWALLWADFR